MDKDKFKGHSRGTMLVKQNDSSGLHVQWHDVRQYDAYSQPVHDTVGAVREIVAECERLRARVAELETAFQDELRT